MEILTIVCSSDCHDCCLGWILCFILSSYNMNQRFFCILNSEKRLQFGSSILVDYRNCCLECCTEQLQCGSANTSGNFWALEIKNFTINISMIRDHPFKTSEIFSWFLTPTPYRQQLFTTICWQIWQIFDPFPLKNADIFNFWRSIFCDCLACCLLWSIQSSGSQYYLWLLLGL